MNDKINSKKHAFFARLLLVPTASIGVLLGMILFPGSTRGRVLFGFTKVMSLYFPPLAVVLCSLGVFIGGIIWSAMYMRYDSIWPGYVSHAIVDMAVFGIGAEMLFW